MALSIKGQVGPLVKVPFTVPLFTAIGTGSSASLGALQPNNPDGRNQQAVMTAGVGPGTYAGVKDIVYGPVVGIRIPRSSGVARAPFDVEIDGVAYPIDTDANTRYDNILNASVVDYESLIVVASGLPDRPHTVKVHVAGDVAAVPAARTLSMFGWLAAQGRGYHQPNVQRTGGMASNTPTTIPTAATQVPVTGLAVALTLSNADASTRIVTITGPDGVTAWRKLTLLTGESQTVVIASPRAMTGYKWSVDSTANVKGWVEVL